MERKNKAVKDGPAPLTSQDMPYPGLGLQGHNWHNKEHETPKKRAVKHCKYFTLSPQSQYLQPAVLGKGKNIEMVKKRGKTRKKKKQNTHPSWASRQAKAIHPIQLGPSDLILAG